MVTVENSAFATDKRNMGRPSRYTEDPRAFISRGLAGV